uniref:Uncharacterized protein n=1 Tax=Anguilla anguilla TaxID=7936 RepID=A0A0E9XXQ9_ANGAN
MDLTLLLKFISSKYEYVIYKFFVSMKTYIANENSSRIHNKKKENKYKYSIWLINYSAYSMFFWTNNEHS